MKKLLYLFLFISYSVFAQKSTVLAGDKLYAKKLYASAIPKYEKAFKKDSSNFDMIAKLGECYRLTNNINGQLLCYGKLVNKGSASETQRLNYAKALMEKGNYESAKTILDGCTTDGRAANLSKGISELMKMSKNADAYQVEPVSFNSLDNDICAMSFGDIILFSSSRVKSTWITRHHGWTDQAYYTTYVTSKEDGYKYVEPTRFFGGMKPKYNEGPISIGRDSVTVYISRNSSEKKNLSSDGSYKLKIYTAQLKENDLINEVELNFNNKEYNCAHPAISGDGKVLYFVSDMPGGYGGMDLYYSIASSDGKWGTPINLGEKVNTKGNELFPFITNDNVLYFASDGLIGMGGLDIYETKIKDNRPSKIYNMGKPVNSEKDDFSYFIGLDSINGFLSSNRKSGGMDDDIYKVKILRKVSRGKNVTFVLKDKDNGSLLPEVKLQINGDTASTDENGEVTYLIEDDVDYKIAANKDKYFEAKDSVNTKSSEEEDFKRTIMLEKDPKLSFLAFITDVKTKEGLGGVKIKIKDLFTKTVFDSTITSANGEYRKSLKGKKIGDKIAYEITLEKDGYLTNKLNFTTEIKQEGEIKLHEVLNMALGKVAVGMDLSKMIDLKPIYFDLGKATVRKDAAIELDKIVKVMTEYPNMYIELGAHTDCRGVAKANLTLSDKRAKASAAYIVKKGIKKDRIVGKGFGESKLLNACACEGKVQPKCSEEEHAKNRRTEFIITKLK